MDQIGTQATAEPAPLPGLLGRFRLLRAMGHPDYRRLWVTGLLMGFGNWMERLTVGWLVLDLTGSPLLTAASFAARSAPNLIFGPIGGAIADRFERKRLLFTALLIKACIALGLGAIALNEGQPIWAIFALVMASGVVHTFELPASQALVVDVVGRKHAANGIAMFSVATRLVGAIGAFTGGVLIGAAGSESVFLLAAISFSAGAFAVSRVSRSAVVRPAASGGLMRNALEGLRIVLGIPIVAILLGFTMLVEILGFTYQSVMPSVADEVLNVGPEGLGTLVAMASVGSFFGSLAVTATSDFGRKGLLAIGVSIVYGLALIGLASSGMFPISVVLVLAVGMMAAAFDALQWTLLQANVPDEMRGRVMGGWVFAIGFGWVGSLELGFLAETIGVQQALAVNGILLAGLGVLTLSFSRRLRRA